MKCYSTTVPVLYILIKYISIYTVGEQLDTQNTMLTRIDDKTSRVNDKTLEATLRSSQLQGSAVAESLGVYQFVEAGTARYLSVSHENIVLLKDCDRSTYFNCFVKNGNLMGIQNAKTLKYLGNFF